MKLRMAGLDHNRAGLEIREMFAVTKDGAKRAMSHIKSTDYINGCVILSTCNRTELYASVPEYADFSLKHLLCRALDKNASEYERHFIEIDDDCVIKRLCRVACGLDSQILGDDQAITQVREALELSRGQDCADSYMETLFRLCVSAAKRIKTEVILRTLGYDSVPAKAVAKLKAMCRLEGKNAVVIGNGQTGRMVSEYLIRENANVTVTLREYKKGAVSVPKGAGVIGYGERYKAVGRADIVVTATTSPHYTLRRNDLMELDTKPGIIVDLAVPRDAEPSIGGIPGVTLLTIDEVSGDKREIDAESLLAVNNIIDDCVNRYHSWLIYKENVLANAAGGLT